MKFIILFLCFYICQGFNIISWWVGQHNLNNNFNWNVYTHLRYGYPISYPNGTVFCNKTDTQFQKSLDFLHKKNIKVLWGPGNLDMHNLLWNASMGYLRDNYINSIGHAVRECNVDGIEVDYEFHDGKVLLGIVTPKESTHYSQFLADIKKSLGKNKLVLADVSIWGIAPGNWILGFYPWINATMLNRGDFDFINTMSYHWNKEGNIWAWEKDRWFIDLWGIDRKRVHIGIPYFSENRTKKFRIYNEPTWNNLSPSCPNISPAINICKNISFVGKEMNYKLGKWAKQNGFGGVFPWAANYDSIQYNNSLIYWLFLGSFFS